MDKTLRHMLDTTTGSVLTALAEDSPETPVRVRINPPPGVAWTRSHASLMGRAFFQGVRDAAVRAGHDPDRIVVFAYCGHKDEIGGRLGSAVEELD